MAKSFLILHGYDGSGPTHWQTWLAERLLMRGFEVYYPQFSSPDKPHRDRWLQELQQTIETIPQKKKVTVIAHSLSCILWLHYASLKNAQSVEKAILVAPPSPIWLSQFPAALSFYPLPSKDEHQLERAAKETMFVLSTNDPYCPLEEAKYYLDLGVSSTILSNVGHINVDAGYGPWEWMLDVCVNQTKGRLGIESEVAS